MCLFFNDPLQSVAHWKNLKTISATFQNSIAHPTNEKINMAINVPSIQGT